MLSFSFHYVSKVVLQCFCSAADSVSCWFLGWNSVDSRCSKIPVESSRGCLFTAGFWGTSSTPWITSTARSLYIPCVVGIVDIIWLWKCWVFPSYGHVIGKAPGKIYGSVGILYYVKFSQNNSDPVCLLGWVGIVAFCFLRPICFVQHFVYIVHFWSCLHFMKNN